MRFLCLHGMGTNSRIFASQTGFEEIVSPGDVFLQYVTDSRESQTQALIHLERYIEEEGPFDILMGFSQGAGCGATYLIHQVQQGIPPAFRCVIFFCGAPPQNPLALFGGGEGNSLTGEIINIPTAHIWGQNDHLWHFGPALSEVCQGRVREVYVHDGGHEIPDPRDSVAFARTLRAIRRTIARAGV